jgi:hypothetical protein
MIAGMGIKRSSAALAMAVTLCLADSLALAQNVPYQSSRRAEYGQGPGQESLPMGLTFEPRLDGAIQYANNTNLASNGGDSSAGIELAPGAYAAYNSERFKGAMDYSLIGRLWDDGDLDDVTHSLAANGLWFAIPEWFSIGADASYGDTLIDSQGGGNYGNMGVFNSGNITEQATASIRPTLQKQFKDFQFRAAYSYGQVWYMDKGKGQSQSTPGFSSYARDDSENQSADVSLGLIPGQRAYSGKFFYSWNRSEFDRSLPYEFERAGFDGGFELSRSLSVVGDVGKESALDESTTAGGLDSDFWSAGLLWNSANRSTIESRYGERFFGSSFLVKINHVARMLSFNASYAETPQVETRRVNLNDFEPGELPPWLDPGFDLGAFNSEPYVGKNGRIGVTAKGSRTTLGLRVFDIQREYLNDLVGDDHNTGVAFSATRQLARNASVDFLASYNDRERDETNLVVGSPVPASRNYDTNFTLRANRDFGPQLVASLESGYFSRSGSNSYDGWWVGLRGRWYPSFGQ